MEDNLLENSADQLLAKFGAGSHTPGSGSATAFQGMLSTQLILTVIQLTLKPQRIKSYQTGTPRLQNISEDIKTRIYPALKELFESDAAEFNKAIALRQRRDKARNPEERNSLAEQAQEQLKTATDIPLRIASLCLELVDRAIFTYDYGFKSARGDSIAAMNCALAGVKGCIGIVDLNLCSFFIAEQWTTKTRKSAELIREASEKLEAKVAVRQQALHHESKVVNEVGAKISELRKIALSSSRLTNLAIEELATDVLKLVWKAHRLIWKDSDRVHPLDILNPSTAFKLMGYHLNKKVTLGQYSTRERTYEIAGTIDQSVKSISVSEQFSLEIQKFTIAHELGHALMHEQAVLHRDRPLDGSKPISRDDQEREADKFATFFLMPRDAVEKTFREIFLTLEFEITETMARALGVRSIGELRKRARNLHGLAKILASTNRFNGEHIVPMSQQFGVSTETMAIRLEELQLIEF